MSEATYQFSFVRGDPGLTIRCDDPVQLTELIDSAVTAYEYFRDKINAVNPVPQQPTGYSSPPVVVGVKGPGKMCNIHGVWMPEAISKKTGNPYTSHRIDGGICFGTGVK